MTIRSVGVEEELRRGRSLAAEVAGRADARVAALATSPVHVEPQLVRTGRYLQMARARRDGSLASVIESAAAITAR